MYSFTLYNLFAKYFKFTHPSYPWSVCEAVICKIFNDFVHLLLSPCKMFFHQKEYDPCGLVLYV